MLKTYLMVALRRLSREQGYAVLNVVSLALGIASAILILLYLRSEFTYDHYHRDYERIYRLSGRTASAGGEAEDQAIVGPGVGPLITRDFPQLGTYTRFQSAWDIILRVDDKERLWNTVYFIDPSFYDVFTHEAVYGDPKDAIDPSAVAVSESFARFYFGDRNPIGQTTLFENGMRFTIAYVFKDLPDNVHLRYDVLVSATLLDRIMPDYSKSYATTLLHPYVHTFVKVPEDFDPTTFEAITRRFLEARMGDQAAQAKLSFSLIPQRLDLIHFGPQLSMDLPVGNAIYAYGFAAVGCFVLLIACINYVNLACARAIKRAKEIGMRRVLGATQRQLICQFLAEAAAVTFAAVLLAIFLVYAALSMTTLGALMEKEHLLSALAEPAAILRIVGLAVLVAIAAGAYPAFYLSRIVPFAALTTARSSWRRGLSIRNALLFVQLAVAVGVIAATLSMMAQMHYVHTKPLGFERQNRLIVTVRRYAIVKQMAAIRAELRKQPGVLDVTTIANVPGVDSWELPCGVETNAATMENVSLRRMAVGANFHEAMKLELVAGRGFDARLASDAAESVIVNESLVNRMGWSSPLDKRIGGPCVGEGNELRVVGVVKDFHYGSLYDSVGPMLLSQLSDTPTPPAPTDEGVYAQSFIVVVAGTNLRRTLDAIENTVRRFDRGFEFEPVFLEEVIAAMYRRETNVMTLMGVFGVVCIGISILGILGLTAFTTEHRTKEIGMRKVLGASDTQVVLMFGRPMLALVLLASVPACYLAHRAIGVWLERFAYRADIGPMTFVLSTGCIVIAAASAVIVQALRAARANPIDSLRYE